MQKQVVIYLHGFNSSPDSFKAVQTKAFFSRYYPDIELVIPHLALTPLAAWQQIELITQQYAAHKLGFIGSSLGGFFATLLANKYDANAVLINPAVEPHLLIDSLVGEYTNPYTGAVHQVEARHGEELKSLQFSEVAQPNKFWVLLQQGDETLDYKLAMDCYRGGRLTIEPLGDHSFVGFNRYLNAIVEFLFKNRP